MSNEKDVSKELADVVSKVLSRREAVKKAGSIAAGAALAFLGLNLPGISQQKSAIACCAGGGCLGTCVDSCGRGCALGCGNDCMYDCVYCCTGNCEGCVITCQETCTGSCNGCYGWCTSTSTI